MTKTIYELRNEKAFNEFKQEIESSKFRACKDVNELIALVEKMNTSCDVHCDYEPNEIVEKFNQNTYGGYEVPAYIEVETGNRNYMQHIKLCGTIICEHYDEDFEQFGEESFGGYHAIEIK